MFRSLARGATKDPVLTGFPSQCDRADVAIETRVAQLLCSRLCHDLAGAAGAIHNGIELMSDDVGADPAALSLVATSATRLNNRLAFYRVAFGLGGGVDAAMTMSEARTLAGGALEGRPVELDWRSEPTQALPLDVIRLILVLVSIGADALARGGTLRVRSARAAAGFEFAVVARGAGAGLPDVLLAAIDADAPLHAVTSRTVHGYFAATLARRLDTVVALRAGIDEVALTVSPSFIRLADPIPFPSR